MAALLRDDCAFWVATAGGEALQGVGANDAMVFRDPGTEDEQKVCARFGSTFSSPSNVWPFQFTGDFNNYDYLKSWVTDKCIPLVREVGSACPNRLARIDQ